MNSMAKKRREGEANSPRGQRPARASRAGPSWPEFVRLAHQAVVAIAGAGMINRAEPRACGSSREPICLDSEPGTKGTQARCQTRPETAAEGHRATRLGLQPYRGKLAVRDETRGWGNRRHDLMAICHDARKSRNIGSHWSKPGAPPPYSTGVNNKVIISTACSIHGDGGGFQCARHQAQDRVHWRERQV
jgi:hypothetical protein